MTTRARLPELRTNAEARDEMNLAEFPITLLTDRVPRGLKTIESEDQFFDDRTGKVIVRRRVITGSDKYGLPTATDDEVILGLLQLTRDANNFTERTVNFSRGELIDRLHWPHSGQSYRRVALSFDCWTSVFLNYEKAWYDNARKSWVDEKFHIIDSVSLYDWEEQRSQPFLKLSSFTWSDAIFRSFQAGYLKQLDLDFYLSLETSTTRRMYRFLDKRFYLKDRWEFDLRDFAFNHIGLSKNYEGNTHILRKLWPSIEELEARGFLEPLTEQVRLRKLSRGEWKITFISKSRRKSKKDAPAAVELEQPSPSPPPAPAPGPGPELTRLELELIKRGVTASTARELVAEYPAERITAQVDQLDWLCEKDPKKVKDPAAYLADAVRTNYAAPAGYVSRAERERREEAKREQQRAEAKAKRQQRDQQARERDERASILEHWNALTVAEQRQLEAQALAQADPEMKENYETAKDRTLRGFYLRLIRDLHIKRLLGIATLLPTPEPTMP